MRPIFLSLLLLPSAAFGKTVVIYHTNDVHGYYFAEPSKAEGPNKGRLKGGFPALAGLLRKEKSPRLLLDSGDIYQGTAEGSVTRGEASITLMNALGYNALAAGNHEFDNGEENLRRLAAAASFPILGANVHRKSDDKRPDYLKDYAVFDLDGIKIGVIGLATRDTPLSTLPSNVAQLEFRDEAAEARRVLSLPELRAADAVVALCHFGLSKGTAHQRLSPASFKPSEKGLGKDSTGLYLARRAGGLAAIFGGHFHASLEAPYEDPVSKTLIFESGAQLESISRLELVFDDVSRKLLSAKGRLIDLWVHETGEDPEVRKLAQSISERVGRRLDDVIGSAPAPMFRSDDSLESDIGNWITDAMRSTASAEAAFTNTRSIRADFDKGPITLRQLYKVMPFDDTLVTLELTGAQIMELIADNIHGHRSKLLVSGIAYTCRLGRDGRPSRLEVKVGNAPIEPSRSYKVATNRYLASGGSGGAVFLKGKNILDTGISVRGLLAEDMMFNRLLKLPPRGRAAVIP
ncbi:MAG: bifunctional metallophosphatase/5'-nucleotidase [Elusimicrobia bacterium]|nr:bifunctional metallophosphatase/5'-nucleotidase [Elusimicrobiota bacterium]